MAWDTSFPGASSTKHHFLTYAVYKFDVYTHTVKRILKAFVSLQIPFTPDPTVSTFSDLAPSQKLIPTNQYVSIHISWKRIASVLGGTIPAFLTN